jgi:hypothetical protein
VSGFGHIDLRVADAAAALPDPSGNRLEIYHRPA